MCPLARLGACRGAEGPIGGDAVKVVGTNVHLPTLYAWHRAGLVRFKRPGQGGGRIVLAPAELRVVHALDSLRRLGGGSLTTGADGRLPEAIVRLRRDVADAARSNPPGTVVELPSPVPWVRHVLVVPEP